MTNYKKIVIIFMIFPLAVFGQTPGQDQGQNKKIKVFGKIISEVTSKPVEYATIVIPELKKKFHTEDDGSYSIELAAPGIYTFLINVEGLKPLEEKIEVKGDMTHDFKVSAVRVQGRSLTVRSNRDIQQVSRITMTSQEIKDTPAGFGDIVRSLTSMPGITSNGFFGSLIMRGADPDGNYYTIDNIPIMDPRHFLGLHTIISADAIGEVDIFSSAAPAQYGFTNAATISLNTIDEVKKLGGVANIGLISANAIVKGPIEAVQGDARENRGYWFVSGRAGYLNILFPLFNAILQTPVSQLPEYYDYQAKLKYYFSPAHSIRLFVMGAGDIFKANPSAEMQAAIAEQNQGGDPLNPFTGVDLQYEQSSHNQAMYYEFKPGENFSNTLMFFSSLNKQIYNMQMQYANSTADISKNARPNIFGIRDDIVLKWMNQETSLRLGFEYLFFDYNSSGIDIVALEPWIPGIPGQSGPPDFSDSTKYELRPYDKMAQNSVIGGYLENKFKWGGFIFTPGVRIGYLKLNEETEVDPRGLLSYEFSSGTTLSLAGGRYSQFVQTNMNYFNNEPEIAATPDYIAEKAIHSVFGVEQKLKDFTIKGEIYYNWFYDITYPYTADSNVGRNDDQLTRISSGVAKNYGFEIILKKIAAEDQQGLFGWISYAYTQAKLKTGVPDESYRYDYINSQREETHSVKAITGFRFGQHTISGKLAFNTSFPYTEINGDDGDPFGIGRYAPTYNETPNTAWYDPVLSLDLRYTFYKPFEWGEISFYIEAINVLGAIYLRRDNLKWDYGKPYASGSNPVLKSSDQVIPIIPNFGVEIKF